MKQVAKPLYTKKQLLLPILFVGALFWGLWNTQPRETTTVYRGETMGTTWSVTLYGSGSLALQKGIQDKLDKVNVLMSTYHPDSEVSRFNRHDTTAFSISKETYQVLQKSLELHQASEGAFDVTLSPLITAWGFGFPPTDRFPTDDEITQTLEYIGTEKLRLTPSSIQKSDPKMQINLSAIAKGYGVDLVAEYLEENQQDNFLVEVGGEIRTKGKKGTADWLIGIEKPEKERAGIKEIIKLPDYAMATSGDYRNYKEKDGVRYSHTLDPRTGKPITHHLASVTVLAPTCMEADAWATTLTVVGTEQAITLAEKHHLAIYMLEKQETGAFKVIMNQRFEAYLKQEE